PGVVRVGMAEVGAVVAGGRARGRAAGVAGQEVVGARRQDVVAAARLLVAVLDAGAVAVGQRAGAEAAGQAQLVGQGAGGGVAAVGAAPQGAVQQRVALAVVRLGPQVVVAGLAVAQDLAQLVLAQGEAGVDRGDVGAGALEVAVLQAVVV